MPDPVASTSDSELRAHFQQALEAVYELEREIGRGGMGIVFRARDRRLKRTVAVKLLPPELAYRAEIRSRFLREAETAAQLSHPNIVPIYSVDERDGFVYFVMACVDGENLATIIRERGRLPADETRRILTEVTGALAYAHARNVVHRDIKPDNILISREDGRALVTDFGIARAVTESADSRLTATGVAIGTPAYMAPEQAAGDRDIDGRTDLYSLGVVAYQMLVGTLPFEASNTPAMLVKHLSERPIDLAQRRPELPADLARAVMLLLEKDPAHRFPSALALLGALEGGTFPSLPASGTPGRAQGGRASALSPVAGAGSGSLGARYEQGGESLTPTDAVSAEQLNRWNAAPVIKFRKKLVPYLFVNGVIVLLSLFTGMDMIGVTAIWSIYMAMQYAKLWTEGFDWRDAFRQPRERRLYDVAQESIDDVQALFNPQKRAEVRARDSARLQSGTQANAGLFRSPGAAGSGGALPDAALYGAYAPVVQQAAADEEELRRLVASLPRQDQTLIGDLAAPARALAGKIRSLARSLAELDRSKPAADSESIASEIERLEGEANPLDRVGSESRVRRLAFLKRQRRATVDIVARRETSLAQLESCRAALESMRLDVLRLKAGTSTHQHITFAAEQAMALAREVDVVLAAADEVSRIAGRGGAPRSPATPSPRATSP